MDDPIQRLKGLLSYIEANLDETVTHEMLELASGFSRFQIIRLFNKFCSLSPAEYIRRRKLSKSVSDLYARRKIIDIALRYGFEYEQSYIRAFRSVYGISPAKLRNSRKEIELFEPAKIGDVKIYSDRFVTEPAVKYFSGMAFAGEEKYYNYKDNNIKGQPLTDGVSRLKGGVFTGICIPCGMGTFTHRYISCVENNPKNSTTYFLPDGRYVIFNYTGLHKLDEAGAHKLRTLMYIVIGSWAARNNVIWNESFIEQVDAGALGDDYCEVSIMIPCINRN